MSEKIVVPQELFAALTDHPAVAQEYARHLSELFASLTPEKIGEPFKAALQQKDFSAAVRLCAAYFRAKPQIDLPRFSADSVTDFSVADRAVRGEMCEVGIPWNFPSGRIDFLFDASHTTGVINHEWVWQLNRHGFWIDMACAYAETGDEKYASAFGWQLSDWIATARCPEDYNGPGSAWRTIECGIRLFSSWPFAFQIFRRSDRVCDLLLLLMIASMRRQAEHLMRHYTVCNWLMMETEGIYCFACMFPEFRASKQYRTTALDLYTNALAEQILPDGMHNELSPDYQAGVYEDGARMIELGRYFGFDDELPDSLTALLKKTVTAAVLLSTPGLTQPRTNDTYTVPTKRFTRDRYHLFDNDSALAFFCSNRQTGTPPAGATASAFLPYAGFCVMRSDWGKDAAYLCFDVGPLGRAHSHQDMLNINLYKGNEELLFDDGGGHYEISEKRQYAISGYDHNTALVDGMAQNRKEPMVYSKPIDVGWKTNDRFDYARGVYDATFGPEMSRPAVHEREVRFCKPDFFCVSDRLTAVDGNAHSYELLFQTDPEKYNRLPTENNAVLVCFGTYDLLLVPIDDCHGAKTEWQFARGAENPCRGWYVGRHDTKSHPAVTVSRTVKDVTNYRFTTLLFPLKHGGEWPTVETADGILTVTFNGKVHRLNLDRLGE